MIRTFNHDGKIYRFVGFHGINHVIGENNGAFYLFKKKEIKGAEL